MKERKSAQLGSDLSEDDLKKCGKGTATECFALTARPEYAVCSMADAISGGKDEFMTWYASGSKLKWRVNLDPVDRRPWCPKGVIKPSQR